MTTAAAQTPKVTEVSPELLATWLDAGDTVLVDVREDFEHAEERIDAAMHHPLSKFDPETIRQAVGDKRVVFHCRSGKRSADAAGRFRQGDEAVFSLAGGIEAWKAQGRGVVKSAGAPRLPVMRQVQIVAGGLVALGVLLGVIVSPWFLILSGFVGCGLMFAGITGWCGMALLLAAMPWNRGVATKASCSI